MEAIILPGDCMTIAAPLESRANDKCPVPQPVSIEIVIEHAAKTL
jgi:hypothetical protein